MKLDQILAIMQDIVEENVHYYKSDFYDYDVSSMERLENNATYIWNIRNTGTYLINNPYTEESIISSELYDHLYKIKRIGDDYSLEEISRETLDTWIEQEKLKYKYVVYWMATDQEETRYKTLEEAEADCGKRNAGRTWESNGYYMYAVKEIAI